MRKIISLLSFIIIVSCDTKENSEENSVEVFDYKIETLSISNINPYDATSGVAFLDEVYSQTEKGVCWSLTPFPTILDNYVNDKSIKYNKTYGGIESYYGSGKAKMKGLLPNTKYYVRGYMKNVSNGDVENSNAEIVYGNEISFTTLSLDDIQIGGLYAGGIVSYILQPSDRLYVEGEIHGLITHEKLSSTGIGSDGCVFSSNFRASEKGIGGDGGMRNTISWATECPNSFVRYVDNLAGDNYNDWYVPTNGEVSVLKTNIEDNYSGYNFSGGITCSTYPECTFGTYASKWKVGVRNF